MHLSFIIALAGATLCLAQTSSNSFSSNQHTSVQLEPRDHHHHHKKHHKKHHKNRHVEDNHHLFYKRGLNPVSLDKRSARHDYEKAVRYMNKARKSYQRAQRENGSRTRHSRNRKSRPVNYLQQPEFERTTRIHRQRPTYNGENTRYYQSPEYSIGYSGVDSPPLPPAEYPPPSPIEGATGKGSGSIGGQEGTSSEVEEWGLKDGKIPADADIEEEDKPDPEQDPSDDTDPPIVDGKPVQREE